MSSIDNRIVQMDFDNKRFESNVKTTMSTLDKLKKSLDFKDQTASLEEFQRTSDSINLSHMANAIDQIANKFTIMGQIGYQWMEKLAKKAVDTGEKILKSISVDQISTGMAKYESETNSVQAIYAAVKQKGKSLDDVYSSLEKLAKYSDETSYSYTQMVDGMAKFIANGIDMDVAEKAMEGIANAAAISGVGIHDASYAFKNFSDALSSGHFMRKDWQSIQNIHMDTEAFKNEVLETAKALGRLDSEGYVLDKNTNKRLSKEAVTIENFQENLHYGFFDTEVMLETLAKYSDFDWDRVYSGEFKTLGDEAAAAAQNAKTFTDVLDSVKDAASTGWKTTFRLIFGDLQEAIDLFTPMANNIISIVQEIGDARNALLEDWKAAGGRDSLISTLKTVWEILVQIKDEMKSALKFVFGEYSRSPLLNGNILANFSKKLQNGAVAFKEWLNSADPQTGATRMQKLFYILRGGASVVDIVRQVFSGIGTFGKEILKQLVPSFDAVLSFFSSIGNHVYDAVRKIKASGVITRIATKLADVLRPLTSRLPNLIRLLQRGYQAVAKWFKTNPEFQAFWKAVKRSFNALLDFLPKAVEGLFTFGKSIWNTVKASSEWKALVSNYNKYIKPLGKKILEFGALTFNALADFLTIDTSGEKGFWNKLKKRFSAFKNLAPWFNKQWQNLKEAFPALNKVEAWWNSSTLVKSVKDFAKKFKKAFADMMNLDTSGISGLWEKFKARLGAFWEELGPYLRKKWDNFKLKHPVVETVTNWLKKAWEDIQKWWKGTNLSEKFSGIWDYIVQAFNKVFVNRPEGQSIFSAIGEWISGLFEHASPALKNTFETVKALFEPIMDWLKDIILKIFIPSASADSIIETAQAGPSIVENVSNAIGSPESISALTKIQNFLRTIDWEIVYNAVAGILKMVYLVKKIQAISKISSSVSGMFTKWGKLFEPFTDLGETIKKVFKDKFVTKKTTKLSDIFTNILKLAASLMMFVSAIDRLGHMDPTLFSDGLTNMALILGIVASFMIIVNNLASDGGTKGKTTLDFTTLIGIVVAVWGISKLIDKFSADQNKNFARGLWKVIDILLVIAGFYAIADGLTGRIRGKDRGSGSKLNFITLMGIVASVWLMDKVIKEIAKFQDTEAYWAAYYKMFAILGAIAAFYLIADGLTSLVKSENNKKNQSKLKITTLLGIVATVWLMDKVIKEIASFQDSNAYWDAFRKMAAILGAIAVFYLIADGFTSLLKKGNTKQNKSKLGVVSLLGIVAAVWLMTKIVERINNNFPEQGVFERAFVKLAAIMALLAGFMMVLNQMYFNFNSILSIIISFVAVVAAFQLFIKAMEILKGYSIVSIVKGVAVVWAVTHFITKLAKTLSRIGGMRSPKGAIAGFIALLGAAGAVAGAMYVFALSLDMIKDVKASKMLAFALSIDIVALGISKLANTASKIGIKGHTLAEIVSSVVMLLVPTIALIGIMHHFSKALENVQSIKPSQMIFFALATDVIAVAVAALAAIAKWIGGKGDFKSVGAGILGLLGPVVAIGAIMWAMSETIGKTKDLSPEQLLAFSKTVFILSGCLAILSFVCAGLGKIGAGTALQGALAIAGVMIALGVGFAAFAAVTGDSIASFAAKMAEVGSALQVFTEMTESVDYDKILNDMITLDSITDKLVDIGSKKLTGLDSFRTSFARLGSTMKIFTSSTSEWDSSKVSLAEDLKKMADSFAEIPELKDVSTSIGYIGSALKMFRLSVMEDGEFVDFSGMTVPDSTALTSMINALAGALPDSNTISTISTFSEEGENADAMVQFSIGLTAIATAFSDFSSSLDNVNFDNVSSGTAALEAIKTLANGLPETGKITNIAGFAIEVHKQKQSLTDLAADVVTLGTALKDFGTNMQDVDNTKVQNGIDALDKIAGLQSSLEKMGGVIQWFTGTKDLARFAIDLPILGNGLSKFSKSLQEVDGEELNFDGEQIASAGAALQSLATAMSNLPETGGLASLFAGDQSGTEFANNLGHFGKGIKSFITTFGDTTVSDDVYRSAEMVANIAQAVKNVSDSYSYVNLEAFGDDVGLFATSLKESVETMNAIPFDDSVIDRVEHMAVKYSELSISLSETMGNNQYTIRKLGEDIKGFVGNLQGINVTDEKLANISEFLTNLIKGINIGDIIKESLASLGLDLSGITDALTSALQYDPSETIAGFFEKIGFEPDTLFSEFLAKFTFDPDALLRSFLDTITFTPDTIIQDFLDKISFNPEAKLQAFLDGVKFDLTTIFQSFIDKINFDPAAIFQGFLDKISFDPMQMFNTFLNGLGLDSENLIESVLRQLGFDLDNSFLGALMDFGFDPDQTLTDFLKSVGFDPQEALNNFFAESGIAKKLSEFSIDELIIGMSNKQDDINAEAGTLAENAADSAKKKQNSFIDAGKYLVEGFAKGIKDNISVATSASDQLAADTVVRLKDILGIESPSRVAMGIGRYLTMGFAIGLEKHGYLATDASESLGHGIIETFRDVLGIHSPSWEFYLAGEESTNGYVDGWNHNVPRIKETFKNTAEAITATANETFHSLNSSLDSFPTDGSISLGTWLDDLMHGKTWADKIVESTEEMVENTKEMADNIEKAADTQATGASGGTFRGSSAAIGSLDYSADFSRMISHLQSISDAILSMLTEISTYFQYQVFGESGVDITKSFAHGVLSNMGIATDAVSTLADNIIESYRDALDWHSLTPWGKQSGADTPASYAYGAEHNLSVIGDATKKVGDYAIDAFNDYVVKPIEQKANTVLSGVEFIENGGAAKAVDQIKNKDYAGAGKTVLTGLNIIEQGSTGEQVVNLVIDALSGKGIDTSNLAGLTELPEELSGLINLDDMSINEDALNNLASSATSLTQSAENLNVAVNGLPGSLEELNGVLTDQSYKWYSRVFGNYLDKHPMTSEYNGDEQMWKEDQWAKFLEEYPIYKDILSGKVSAVNTSGSSSSMLSGTNGADGSRAGSGMNNANSLANATAAAQIDYSADLARIIEEVTEMNDRLEYLSEEMTNLQIVMDTGALVGSTSAAFDMSLGRRTSYADRGIQTSP